MRPARAWGGGDLRGFIVAKWRPPRDATRTDLLCSCRATCCMETNGELLQRTRVGVVANEEHIYMYSCWYNYIVIRR